MIGHLAFRVHGAVHGLGCVVGVCGQRKQVRLLFQIKIDRSTLGFPVQAQVGRGGQPSSGHFVEVFERGERTAVEQVGVEIIKRPLDFPFRLGMPGTTGPGLETVVRGERQEPRVVDWLFPVVTGHHHLHVVVQAGGG